VEKKIPSFAHYSVTFFIVNGNQPKQKRGKIKKSVQETLRKRQRNSSIGCISDFARNNII
jgi:hypothetical protein